MYTLVYGIYRLNGLSWQLEVDSYWPLQGMYSTSSTNAFVVGQNSYIFHYNGHDWVKLNNIIGDGWWLRGVWATEREAFIVGFDGGGFKTVILHGK